MAIDKRVVETTHGPVRGAEDGGIATWKGIRYAAPPIGDLRFRLPEPPERWAGDDKRDAVTRYADAHIRAAWGSEVVSFR